ncbi:two-component system sensor histidine kinase CreC [Comamonas serinivorans]|uniref:histidine kinase n=1 Tax=Comamonas serinivorans TaxID=1082851 RepID=A0A1Y0ES89_9BURK|nr:two-component system sensor histidine kinase CreC [Comamonas serinivorans]
MSRRTRIFLAVLIVYTLGTAWLLSRVTSDLDPRYRESAEESQIDMAQLLASQIEQDVVAGAMPLARLQAVIGTTLNRRFSAQVYNLHKTRVELRVTVTDRNGIVQYDSTGRDVGADFSGWRDVSLTLQGLYGARATRDVASDSRSTVLYVAAPVRWGDDIVGVVTVGKPVQSFGQFVADARERTIWVGIGSASFLLVFAFILSIWLIRPFGLVRDMWRWLRRQKSVSPGRVWRQSLLMLRAASHDVRDAVGGRQGMATQVEIMSHELKSPLSAIAAAAELMQDTDMPAAQRQHFLDNITRETQRIRHTVDRLMELSRLETLRVLDQVQDVDVQELLHEVVQTASLTAVPRQIKIDLIVSEGMVVEGDRFLLSRAVANLLANAIDFSPDGGDVQVRAKRVRHDVVIEVSDSGPGMPAYAVERVFDKFYSLPRPHSQRKSTGLGLSFVNEIAKLHGGSAQLRNREFANGEVRGACASLVLPARFVPTEPS